MRALLISDVECPALWDYFRPERLRGADLIISCGDLKREYLEFLVTMSGKPVFYVPGNHDGGYVKNPPEGCECLDDKVICYRGVRFLGFGGCKRYNLETYQYTEKEMTRRIRRAGRQIRKNGGVDVVVTHAAPTGLGDRKDPAHQGFDCFRDLMDQHKPAFLVHGHVHMNYDRDIPRLMTYGDTTIINAYERYLLEIPESP
jgi:Icc-related predicted phosphoesterase